MGAIHLSEVRCSGQEPSLWRCPSKNITAEDCSHSQDAGVRCNLPYTGVETKVSHTFYFRSFYSGPDIPQLPHSPAICEPFLCPCSLLQTAIPKVPPNFPSILLQIRLSGGRSRYEGRVEVQIGVPGHLRWGLICGDDWGTLEAMVACRQLGLGYANHGLQVSREKRKLLVVTKICVLGKDCGNTSLGPGN